MPYCAYITQIKNLRKHSNADRLQCGQCFGNNVIVNLETKENETGIYFPVDGKLSPEYSEANNLLIRKDENGVNVGGYLDPDKRNIKALKLRGEQSDGLFMPIASLAKFADITALKPGDQITILNGTLICEKYIPRSAQRQPSEKSPKTNKKTKTAYPLFMEHSDTSQLAYNAHAFREGDLCEITLKMHGTSQRTAYTLKETGKYIPHIIYKIISWLKIPQKTMRTWEYVSGTRRTVLNSTSSGWYGNNAFRQPHHNKFVGKLKKGETAYYEVVGYVSENSPIMTDCPNKRTNDKSFIKQYGETTRFHYGCANGQSEIYVYRMTLATEEGHVIEYPYDLVQIRCEQIGVKPVPLLDKFIFATEDDLMARVEAHCDGADPIGKDHIREGVVVRIENRERFTAYKHKNINFKILEGIIKDAAAAPDMEEAQETQTTTEQ